MTGNPMLPGELHEEIISIFEHHLREQGSPLLNNADTYEQILDQVRSVIDEVVYGTVTSSANVNEMSRSATALERMHPAESLRAASLLFETALPFVIPAFSAIGRSDVEAALVLHRVIMRRICLNTVPYPGLMVKTSRDSHRAELARLARDLHDHTAHTIGVAIQNLESHEMYASRDPAQAREKLNHALDAMRQALDAVRRLSSELRTRVRPDGLEEALKVYLAGNAESNILTSVKVTGDTARLPGEVCEEVYVTLREAIRNALVHSGATRLDVIIEISESQLQGRVSDTGRGFLVEKVMEAGQSIGLFSMRERLELLGGALRLSSLLGQGTTVEISVPLGKVRP